LNKIDQPNLNALESQLKSNLPDSALSLCTVLLCKATGIPEGLSFYEAKDKSIPGSQKLLVLLNEKDPGLACVIMLIVIGNSPHEKDYVSLTIYFLINYLLI